MKLCADILYWRLKEKLTTVTQRGKGGSALTLNQFYDLIGEKTAAMEITDETRKMMTSFFCCSLLGYVMKFLWVNMNVDIDASVDDLSIIFSGALEAMLRKEMGQ